MINWQRYFSALLIFIAYVQNLPAMEFDFQPLSSLCRVEVNLATGFGSGTVKGDFWEDEWKNELFPENPQQMKKAISF